MTDRMIRYSATSTFLESRRLYMLKYIHNLERIYSNDPSDLRPMQPFDVGNIGHFGLSAFYQGRGLNVARRALKFEAAFQKTYDTDKCSKQGAFDAFERYIAWLQESKADKNFTVVNAERRLYIDMGVIRGDHVTLTVEPDVVVQDQFGMMHVFDHKFVDKYASLTSFIGSNRQGFTYALACQQHYGEMVRSFTLNQIKRTVPKKPTTPFVPVDRVTQFLNPDMIERHRVYLMRLLDNMVQLHQEVEAGDESGAIPNPTWSCATMCNMFDICCNGITKEPALLADDIRTRYQRKEQQL